MLILASEPVIAKGSSRARGWLGLAMGGSQTTFSWFANRTYLRTSDLVDVHDQKWFRNELTKQGLEKSMSCSAIDRRLARSILLHDMGC